MAATRVSGVQNEGSNKVAVVSARASSLVASGKYGQVQRTGDQVVLGTHEPQVHDAEEGTEKSDGEFLPMAPPITISAEAYDRLVAICMAPPKPPNKRLLEAMRLAKQKGFIS